MILDPKTNWFVTSLTDIESSQIQPNGVDLKLEEVYKIMPGAFHLSEITRTDRPCSKIETDQNDIFILEPGFYKIKYKQRVSIPSGECGYVVPRSTLMRNGVMIYSALYDTGYGSGEGVEPGEMWGLMQVSLDTFLVQKNTRIAQYITFVTNSQNLYNGQYQKLEDPKKTEQAEESKLTEEIKT